MKNHLSTSANQTNLPSTPVPPANGWIDAVAFGASGSEFEAIGAIQAESNQIKVENVGDFKVGQQVSVSRCHIHHYGMVYNDKEPYFAKNQKPLEDEIEIEGLDGDKAWRTFLIHFDRTEPVTFRWMAVHPDWQTKLNRVPVLSREWIWQGENLPVDDQWRALNDGVRIRFKKKDWLPGQSVSFHARDRLLATITAIDGNVVTLSKAATRDAAAAVVRHVDQDALQTALDQAIAERKGLFIPAGRYRLTTGLWIRNATVRIEGAHRDLTLLDISEEHTAVFWISGGREVTIRSLAMMGHTGFIELPANTHFPTANGHPYWPTANQQMEIKGCAAVNFVSTEHILFEDLRVSRMASEAFYSHGADRYGTPPYVQAPHEGRPELAEQYTKSCVFHRCHVIDCGFNAFNNNDHAENTSILHCRVEKATNFCENASRFTRVIGNYCLDGCATSVHAGGAGDPRKIGSTQAVIADNVFEAGILGGGVSVGNHATQVVIANNLFIGYGKESAIFLNGGRRLTVTGNHIDMTSIQDYPDNERCGICVEASNVLIADNQIYDRGERSDKVTGIHVADHAVNVHIHDNIIENCACGLRTGRRVYVREPAPGRFEFKHTETEVANVVSPNEIIIESLPVQCDVAHPFRGWKLRWLDGEHCGQTSSIEQFDPETKTLRLAEVLAVKAGDRLAIFPTRANWRIHHNTITDCERSTLLELFESENVHVTDNITD